MAEGVVASAEQMSSQAEAPKKRLWTTNPDCLDIDLLVLFLTYNYDD